jgi:hypothetical protein
MPLYSLKKQQNSFHHRAKKTQQLNSFLTHLPILIARFTHSIVTKQIGLLHKLKRNWIWDISNQAVCQSPCQPS